MSIVESLTGFTVKENLWYQQLKDEPNTLDAMLFENLEKILSDYKKNVDKKNDTMKSIKLLKEESQQLEQDIIKSLQSDLTKSLLYPPILKVSVLSCVEA